MRRLSALFAVSFLVLAFSACSGGDSLSTGRTTTTTEEDDGGTTTTTEGDEETTTTTTEGGGETGGEVCDSIQALNDAEDPSSPADLAAFIDDFSSLRDQLPDDLADDLEVFSEFFIQVLAAAEDNGGDVDAALEDAFTNLSEDDLSTIEDATAALDQFGEEECGIESDGSGDDTTTTTAGSDDGPDEELGDPSPPPDLDDPEEADLADQCFQGDLAACDDLWITTDVDSPGEQYAESCGGRVEGPEFGACEADFG
jgi:hypothetical protein